MKLNRLIAAFFVGICCVTTLSAFEHTVEKVADFSTGLVGNPPDVYPYGGYYPLDRLTQVGTNLWFTTQLGGRYAGGTVSRFDLVTHELVQVASLGDDGAGNNIGVEPECPLVVVSNNAYVTALNGGAGLRGSILRVNLDDGTIALMASFPTNLPGMGGGTNLVGSFPRSGMTQIGDALYGTTSSGGSNGSRGTIFRYSLSSNQLSAVHHFDNAPTGNQPYERFTKVGNAYYFTTFTGGVNSSGTLGRMTFDNDGKEVITKLADLTSGHSAFPAQNPVAVGTNLLFFMTVGPNGNPGSIIRYTISAGQWTNVFFFSNNLPAQLLYGKQAGYNGLTEWQNELYFLTRQGGISNLGVVAKFNIANNTVTKLADLDGVGPTALGNESSGYNSGTVVEVTNRYYMYFPIARGGAFAPGSLTTGLGTIIRVSLPPPPIQLSISNSTSDQYTLSWTGGYEPFSVQTRNNLGSGSWTNLVEGLTNRSLVLTNPAGQTFFRVGGS